MGVAGISRLFAAQLGERTAAVFERVWVREAPLSELEHSPSLASDRSEQGAGRYRLVSARSGWERALQRISGIFSSPYAFSPAWWPWNPIALWGVHGYRRWAGFRKVARHQRSSGPSRLFTVVVITGGGEKAWHAVFFKPPPPAGEGKGPDLCWFSCRMVDRTILSNFFHVFQHVRADANYSRKASKIRNGRLMESWVFWKNNELRCVTM